MAKEREKLYIDNVSYKEEVAKLKQDKFKSDANKNRLNDEIATLKDELNMGRQKMNEQKQ